MTLNEPMNLQHLANIYVALLDIFLLPSTNHFILESMLSISATKMFKHGICRVHLDLSPASTDRTSSRYSRNPRLLISATLRMAFHLLWCFGRSFSHSAFHRPFLIQGVLRP